MPGIVATAQKLFRRAFYYNDSTLSGSPSGHFDAAGLGDRWPMSSQLWSPVSQSLAAAGPMSTRAGWLAENSPTAASFVEVWVSALASTAPTVRSGHPDPEKRAQLEKAFNRWAKRCDLEGRGDLGGYLAKAIRTLVITGDSFTHMVMRDGRLMLRLIATDQVWRPYTRILPDGHRIFSGVEVDEDGKRVAYWTLPVQMDMPWAVFPMPSRIGADDMLHTFIPAFPGAVRGLSWFTSIATRCLELDRLEDAAMARANTSALFTGWIRDIDNTSGFATDAQPDERDGKPTLSMEPGELRRLPPGCDIVFPSNIPDMQGLSDFLKHMLRSIAAGGGVPASLLTGDLSDVNYSSARAGLEQFKRCVGRIQQCNIVAQLLQPVWERFVTLEILSGRFDAPDFEADPDLYFDVEFRWPAWASLDPQKDANADIDLMNAKLRSRAEIIAARGRDVEDVDREIDGDPYKNLQTSRPPAQPQEVQNAA